MLNIWKGKRGKWLLGHQSPFCMDYKNKYQIKSILPKKMVKLPFQFLKNDHNLQKLMLFVNNPLISVYVQA